MGVGRVRGGLEAGALGGEELLAGLLIKIKRGTFTYCETKCTM